MYVAEITEVGVGVGLTERGRWYRTSRTN